MNHVSYTALPPKEKCGNFWWKQEPNVYSCRKVWWSLWHVFRYKLVPFNCQQRSTCSCVLAKLIYVYQWNVRIRSDCTPYGTATSQALCNFYTTSTCLLLQHRLIIKTSDRIIGNKFLRAHCLSLTASCFFVFQFMHRMLSESTRLPLYLSVFICIAQ